MPNQNGSPTLLVWVSFKLMASYRIQVQGEGMDLHGIAQAHVCNTVPAVTKSELLHLASRVQWEEYSCKLLGMHTVYYQSCIQNLE